LRRIGVVTMLVLLHGCAPLPTGADTSTGASAPGTPIEPPQPLNPWLGRIAAIEGPNTFFDKGGSGPVVRATVGQLLYAHDRFFTGPGSHMLVQFKSGGQVELDENTDPTLIQELNCLVISLFQSGRMFVDKNNVCVEALQVASNQHSVVVYGVLPGSPPGVRITVLEGQAELVRPSRVPIPAGWRIEANVRGVMGDGRAFRLPPEELQRSSEWLRLARYGPSPYAPSPSAPTHPPPVVTPQPYTGPSLFFEFGTGHPSPSYGPAPGHGTTVPPSTGGATPPARPPVPREPVVRQPEQKPVVPDSSGTIR
jgi:hypothetical protein